MKYLRRFVGAKELIHGLRRWCLWLKGADPQDLRASAEIRRRLEGVAAFRSASKKGPTRNLAATPYLFGEDRQPVASYLCIPRHVSENRRYFPVVRLEPNVVSGDHNFVAEDPDGVLFALLSSSMFIAWMRAVAGRLRADLRFSNTLVWNTFPFPELDEAGRAKLSRAGEIVLEARATHPEASLADLYDPLSMPALLLQAHDELDHIVDAVFAPRRRFHTDADRLALLFERYEALITAGQLIPPMPKTARRR